MTWLALEKHGVLGRDEKKKKFVKEIGVKFKDLIVACSFTGLVEKLNLPDLEL